MGTLTSPIASRRFRLAVLVLSTAACAVSALYFGYLKGLDTVYTHFFYVPIILGGLWFDKKAVVVAALLGGVYLTSLHASGAGVEVDDLMRACVMVLMAFVVGIISARRSRAEKALADYRHRLEQMVSDRTVELSDANEKLRLLGGMTRHDLLNQLSILVGWLELARESRPDGKSCKELERAAESAEVIREDLQFAADYERIGLIRPTWVSASHSFLMGASRFKLSDILMTNDLGALEVLADPMVEKVFMNLIDNSIRHGCRVTRIRARWEKAGNGVTVIYDDDGCGIAQDLKAKLFESGSGNHTGLGLFMARKILSITGITIEETGQPGAGARFEIHVPEGKFRFAEGS